MTSSARTARQPRWPNPLPDSITIVATSRKYRTRFTQAVVALSVSFTALGLNVPQLLAATVASPIVTAPVWARVTAPNGNNNDQVSAVRTPDGALHVVWVNPGPGATEDLHETVLSSSGRAQFAMTIAKSWSAIANPAIVRLASGALAVVAGATRSTTSSDPILNQALWTSQNGGSGWTLTPADIAVGSGGADLVSAAVGRDGSTIFATWATTAGLFVHRGVDAKVAALNFQAAPGWTCCGYDPGIALNPATHAPVVGWYSNATHHTGVYAQTVNPSSGAPVGGAVLLPGSATNVEGQPQAISPAARTPVVQRPGGGIYLAAVGGYPVPRHVLVWKYPSAHAAVVGVETGGAYDATLAADPQGRLWAIWASGRSASPMIHARRSNPTVTAWGAEVSVPARPGSSDLWKLDGYAQRNVIDVLASVSTPGSLATWHTSLEPGLTVTAETSAKPRGLRLRVTDAGVPVAGAALRAGGFTVHTGASGQTWLALPASKVATSVRVTASAPEYVAATLVASVPAG